MSPAATTGGTGDTGDMPRVRKRFAGVSSCEGGERRGRGGRDQGEEVLKGVAMPDSDEKVCRSRRHALRA